MWSARVGCVQAARILLESGASVSATNEFGATALHEAVDSGSQEVAALLVERGADPNVQDGRGNTPLMLAARCGHGNADVSASVVRTLMESDTAVGLEVTNNDGQTALTWAVVNGHIKLVRLLMQQGSDPMTIDNDGRGILAVTAGTGQENLMKAMLESVLSANTPEEVTKSNQKAARMFSLQDNSGNTPLIAAARHSGARGGDPSEAESASLDCCKVVCSYEGGRETIDMQNHDGDTALIGAVRADRATVVAFLIEQGADRAVENNWGMTAEFLVGATASASVFFLLAELDVSHTDCAESQANEMGHEACVKILSQKKTKRGARAESFAASRGPDAAAAPGEGAAAEPAPTEAGAAEPAAEPEAAEG